MSTGLEIAVNFRFECARCREEHSGRRLLIEQNATDDSGLQTVVEKRWTLCPPCAEAIMALVGEVSPWHSDSRTVVLPDSYDEPVVRVFALSR
ncbi:MAG: hypothetical protein ABR520_10765 [Mycobacteriales bacterium]|nr:hypothetical protein [Frankia sp.]